MAAAPGRNEHVAGYLQHTARYTRDTPVEVKAAGKNSCNVGFFFFLEPVGILVLNQSWYFVLQKTATWRIRLLADSEGILSLMNTYVIYLIPTECVTLALTGRPQMSFSC